MKAQTVRPEELLTHLDWIRSLARGLAADPERALDVEQETWRTALEHPPRRTGNLRGWLAQVARNASRQLSRSEAARANRERRAARSEALESAAELAGEAALQRELVDRVLRLDEDQRTALILRYFRGLPPR